MKQDLDKLQARGFINLMEEVTWRSPIMVVLKKNRKFQICVDFWKLNITTKNDPYPLPFTKEVIDMVVKHELYSFQDNFSRYQQIMITPKNTYKIAFITNWGTFVWIVMPFGLKHVSPTYQRVVSMAFCEYLKVFMKLILNDLYVLSDLKMHLAKLQLCFHNVVKLV